MPSFGGNFNVPNITPTIGIPIFFPPLPMGGADGFMSSRKIGAMRRSKYTPDYAGLILGKKGKAPKMITGAEIRPITKGFSFFGKSSNKLFKKWF